MHHNSFVSQASQQPGRDRGDVPFSWGSSFKTVPIPTMIESWISRNLNTGRQSARRSGGLTFPARAPDG